MSKHTVDGFIVYQNYEWNDKPTYTFLTYKPDADDMSPSSTLVSVCEHSIEIEVPDDFDPRPKQVAALTAQKQKLRAAFAQSVMEIDEQINKLLCLENAA